MRVIQSIRAREILDSRGNPTIEAEVLVNKVWYRASVPSGASTGRHEALELRDGGKRYWGKGVRKAVIQVEKIIAPLLIGKDCRRQAEIDYLMIKKDGTHTKSKLGANAVLAVSLACARAGGAMHQQPLYSYIHQLLGIQKHLALPQPYFNVINGGKHAENDLPFQEFFIVPRVKTFAEALRMGSETYQVLKKVIEKKYGKLAANVGDEGGFAPPVKSAEEALILLRDSIKAAGYQGKIEIGMDCAASEFYHKGYYSLLKKMTPPELLNYYLKLITTYSLVSLEDPFEQEDFSSFAKLTQKSSIQVVGDDLLCTNVERIKRAIAAKSCTCLLLKVNQIGTLTEALDAVRVAYQAGWKVMVSHRSGETEDTFIADLAVGIGCGMIKAGAPCRGERTVKYNQLLRIEEELK